MSLKACHLAGGLQPRAQCTQERPHALPGIRCGARYQRRCSSYAPSLDSQPSAWHPCHLARRRGTACAATQSVDPLSKSDGIYRPGKTFTIHSKEDLQQFAASDKLTVLMAKSSHCRPCKKFASTYHLYAEKFADSQLIEIVGDESPATRKMMVAMKVKVTPSFFLYRKGELLLNITGTTRGQLRKAIIERLGPQEAGKDWVEQPVVLDSDSDDD